MIEHTLKAVEVELLSYVHVALGDFSYLSWLREVRNWL